MQTLGVVSLPGASGPRKSLKSVGKTVKVLAAMGRRSPEVVAKQALPPATSAMRQIKVGERQSKETIVAFSKGGKQSRGSLVPSSSEKGTVLPSIQRRLSA